MITGMPAVASAVPVAVTTLLALLTTAEKVGAIDLLRVTATEALSPAVTGEPTTTVILLSTKVLVALVQVRDALAPPVAPLASAISAAALAACWALRVMPY